MKKLMLIVSIVLFTTTAYATIKCVPDGRGGMCCWDVETQGPFKPISC